MVDACTDVGVVFMEAFVYRLHPMWQAVIDIVRIEVPFNIPPDQPARLWVTTPGDAATGAVTEVIAPVADHYRIEAEEFAAAVLGNHPTPIPPSDGVANMIVIERLLASAAGA